MVLYPLNTSLHKTGGRGRPPHANTMSAWAAVERRQKQAATAWWLIAQPDHAALAGELAARISSPHFPQLDTDVLQAITLHDEGWAPFDSDVRTLNGQGRPVSFLEVAPADALRAWRGSIEKAEQVAAVGGIIVSEHFCRLANGILQSGVVGESSQMILEFLRDEAERQKQLSRQERRSTEELAALVDVLQFCDLLSLYLCCGSQDSVEFPQKFNGPSIRVHHEGELCRLEPPLLGEGVSLAVTAREYPGLTATSIPFLLA
jgi:hypothetical protein